MDIKAVGEKIGKLIKKYRVAILILVLGIVLMILPTNKTVKSQEQSSAQPVLFQDPAKELSLILSQIQGAGKVQILLTKGAGERTVYQTDQERDNGDGSQSIRIETVIVNDKDRNQKGLIQQHMLYTKLYQINQK